MAKRIQRTEKRQSTRIHKISEQKPTRYYSSKQEQSIAKQFDGNQTKNSGATMFIKGDVSLDNFLIEAKTKTTHSKSITIHKEWIDKNKQEAIFMGKPYSAIAFNFGPDEENHYIIDSELFEILIKSTQEL